MRIAAPGGQKSKKLFPTLAPITLSCYFSAQSRAGFQNGFLIFFEK
jgi:hypothetical protein